MPKIVKMNPEYQPEIIEDRMGYKGAYPADGSMNKKKGKKKQPKKGKK